MRGFGSGVASSHTGSLGSVRLNRDTEPLYVVTFRAGVVGARALCGSSGFQGEGACVETLALGCWSWIRSIFALDLGDGTQLVCPGIKCVLGGVAVTLACDAGG